MTHRIEYKRAQERDKPTPSINEEVEKVGKQRNCTDESAQVFERTECNFRLNHC